MPCQLCHYEFDAKTMACHAGCPLGSHCNLICCPNCGYQVVDASKSRLVKLLRRLWPSSGQTAAPRAGERPERAGKPVVPLTHIPVGQEVKVYSLEDMPPGRLTKLSVFGVVPGGRVQVLQHRLSPVVRIGETELALSQEVMDQIWVWPDSDLSS